MLRYLRSLADKDLALDRSMIPLGSCTMKLNATSEMIPITWPEFANVHPFAPRDQLAGYAALNDQLSAWLCAGHRLRRHQPAAQRRARRASTPAAGDPRLAREPRRCAARHLRDPRIGARHQPGQRADGRPAGGGGGCDAMGNVDLADLRAKREQHAIACRDHDHLPSTYGVFEAHVKELCALVHEHGGRSTSTART